MIVFTHRGIEPSRNKNFMESSIEAFEDHLKRGFGIEFDLNFAKDGIIAFHDLSLRRVTNERDIRDIRSITVREIKQIIIGQDNRIPSLDEVLELIEKYAPKLCAIHFKGKFQNKDNMDNFIKIIQKYRSIIPRILVFDLKPESALYLKKHEPELMTIASVSKKEDIEKYGPLVDNTLLSIEEVLSENAKKIYSGVWLDEWSTRDIKNNPSHLYTNEVFNLIRKNTNYKIFLVTPELHGTSPGLYGEEPHPDSNNIRKLFSRISKILSLNPDGLCTDYPEEVIRMLK